VLVTGVRCTEDDEDEDEEEEEEEEEDVVEDEHEVGSVSPRTALGIPVSRKVIPSAITSGMTVRNGARE